MALAVPLSRFTSRVGGGSAFFVRPLDTMKITKLKFCAWLVLLAAVPAAIICLSGCEMFAGHTNPIAGWKVVGEVGCKVGEMSAEVSPIIGYKEISDDVQKFVNKLPVDHLPDYCGGGTRRWCYWLEDMRFYEDVTGQHAVGFHIPHDGTWWGYVLIYDKNNKRVKAVRYVEGHYAC